MPTFAYRALTTTGERVTGELEAADVRTAIARLQDSGLIPIDAAPATGARAERRAAPVVATRAAKHVTQLTRELATLLGAGQTVEGALALAREEIPDKGLAAAVENVLLKVRSGSSLSDALAAEPRYFPPLYISIVRAGEASGKLGASLAELGTMRERTEALRSKLNSAMIYPVVLFLTAIGAVIVLLTVVVPRMEPMFANAGAALPASTQVVLAAADFVRNQGYLLLVAVTAALFAGERLLRRPGPRTVVDRWLLRLPMIGMLIRDRMTAQFCRGLATCLGGGLDLPQALLVSRDILGNLHGRVAMDDVITRVRTGRTLADSLTQAGILAPLAVKMLRVGEESGRLQPVAAHLAGTFEERVATRLQRLVAIIEPATVIVLGLVVGGIVMSILTAVLSVNELAL
ncbi:type II secretion system F family protein [Benzoatithermus flavus]|uniref:Type II secretion system F family protein n=1 Tax=Benzoatithermus flavus TaxID=3108223 RepID=A0ABU8XSF5_9PROT